MPLPHNFTTLGDFFPFKYSKILFAQQMQFLFLFALIFSSSFFQTSKKSNFFPELLFFNNIFNASVVCKEAMICVMVFNTPAVSQVSNCAASLKKHLKHGLFSSGIALKT